MSDTNKDIAEEPVEASTKLASVANVGWFRQLRFVLQKNGRILRRRPIYFIFLIFSSVASVLLAWAAGRDRDDDMDFSNVPLTECGVINATWYQSLSWEERYNVPVSYNENWRSGLAVTVMGEYHSFS